MRQVPESPRHQAMTVVDFQQKKRLNEQLCLITCYDYPSARIIADTAIDAVLVGDSVAMVVHGHDHTLQATLPMMCLHTEAVARGLGNQLLIADLPFLSYHKQLSQTVDACGQLMQAGAHAVKLEGGDPYLLDSIAHLVASGIPVMGHLGLTPQSVHQLGGYRVQAKQQSDADKLFTQAEALAQAGCFALVLECIPATLAHRIQQHLSLPVIGIGAGAHCDGQILVWHDLLGIQDQRLPKFVKQYARMHDQMVDAIGHYCQEVRQNQFPQEQHSYAVL